MGSFTHDILDLSLSLSLDWWKRKTFYQFWKCHPVYKGNIFVEPMKKSDNILKFFYL